MFKWTYRLSGKDQKFNSIMPKLKIIFFVYVKIN